MKYQISGLDIFVSSEIEVIKRERKKHSKLVENWLSANILYGSKLCIMKSDEKIVLLRRRLVSPVV